MDVAAMVCQLAVSRIDEGTLFAGELDTPYPWVDKNF